MFKWIRSSCNRNGAPPHCRIRRVFLCCTHGGIDMKVQNFDPKILNFVELYRILDHADLAADFRTLKTTTGFVVVLAGGLVSWMSKLQ